jgi:hypothetical protein
MAIGIDLLMVMVVVVLAWGEQFKIFMTANIATLPLSPLHWPTPPPPPSSPLAPAPMMELSTDLVVLVIIVVYCG